MGILFTAWVIFFVQAVEDSGVSVRAFLRNYGWGIFVSLLLTGFIFISVKPQFRLLSDETNLLSVSKSMAFNKTVENVTHGKWIDFNYHPLEKVLEKRPFLFPFLVHLLHIFLGYQTYHPFVVNFLALFGIFTMIFIMAKPKVGFIAACALLFMIAAQPVITQTAASGAIDLICVFFIILSLLSMESYLENPSESRFRLLWVHLLLLANTRYEAPLYFLVAIVFLFWFKKMKREYLSSFSVCCLTPCVLLPTFWQRFFLETNLQVAEGDVGFSLGHFLRHHADFLKVLFHFDFYLPYATIINLVGVFALVYFTFLYLTKRWLYEDLNRLVFIFCGIIFSTYWVITNAYHGSHLIEQGGVRTMTLMAVVFSVMAFMLFNRVRFFEKRPIFLLVLGIFFFCLYHPVAVESRFSNKLSLTREYRIAIDFLKRQNGRNFLVIAFRSNLYAVHNYGAVDFYYANQHKDQILREFEERVFSDIFVIQEVDMVTRVPNERTALDSAYRLNAVFERQKDYTTLLRFSRVVGSKEDSGAQAR